MAARCASSAAGADEPATQIVLLFLLPFASYLIAEHIGVSGISAAVAAGMTITRSGVMRTAPLAMPARQQHRAMLEFVFNGMVFLLLPAAAGYPLQFAGGGGGRPQR